MFTLDIVKSRILHEEKRRKMRETENLEQVCFQPIKIDASQDNLSATIVIITDIQRIAVGKKNHLNEKKKFSNFFFILQK